jgi:hypothetical protein
MWVNAYWVGLDDRVLFAESNASPLASNPPLFSLGSSAGATSAKLRAFFRPQINSSVAFDRSSSFDVFDGQWHHVVWTDSNGSAALYVDGVRDATNFSYSRNTSFRSTFDSIGAAMFDNQQGDKRFIGQVDEVRILNRTLSASEIARRYYSNLVRLAHGSHDCPDLPVQHGRAAELLGNLCSSRRDSKLQVEQQPRALRRSLGRLQLPEMGHFRCAVADSYADNYSDSHPFPVSVSHPH